MSVTTPVSNMPSRDQQILEDLVAGACSAVVGMCSAAVGAANGAIRQDRVLSALERQEQVRRDLEGALDVLRSRTTHTAGSLQLAGASLQLGRQAARLNAGAGVLRLRGPSAAISTPATPGAAEAPPHRPPSRPVATIEVVWSAVDAVATAFQSIGCDVRGDEAGFEVVQDRPLLRARRIGTERYAVDVLDMTGALALEAANRRYIQAALAKHAVRTGSTVENRNDGTTVVRAAGSPRARVGKLERPAAGTIEVDFTGYRGGACRQALTDLQRSTGLRATRLRGKADQPATVRAGATVGKKR